MRLFLFLAGLLSVFGQKQTFSHNVTLVEEIESFDSLSNPDLRETLFVVKDENDFHVWGCTNTYYDEDNNPRPTHFALRGEYNETLGRFVNFEESIALKKCGVVTVMLIEDFIKLKNIKIVPPRTEAKRFHQLSESYLNEVMNKVTNLYREKYRYIGGLPEGQYTFLEGSKTTIGVEGVEGFYKTFGAICHNIYSANFGDKNDAYASGFEILFSDDSGVRVLSNGDLIQPYAARSATFAKDKKTNKFCVLIFNDDNKKFCFNPLTGKGVYVEDVEIIIVTGKNTRNPDNATYTGYRFNEEYNGEDILIANDQSHAIHKQIQIDRDGQIKYLSYNRAGYVTVYQNKTSYLMTITDEFGTIDALTETTINVTGMTAVQNDNSNSRAEQEYIKTSNLKRYSVINNMILYTNYSHAYYDGQIVDRNGRLTRMQDIFIPSLLQNANVYNQTITSVMTDPKNTNANEVSFYRMIARDTIRLDYWDVLTKDKVDIVNMPIVNNSYSNNYNSSFIDGNYAETNNMTAINTIDSVIYLNRYRVLSNGQEVTHDGSYRTYHGPQGFGYIRYYWDVVTNAIISAFNRIFGSSRSIPRRFSRNIQQLEQGANPVEVIEEINLLLTPRQTRRFRRNVNRNLRLLETNNSTALQSIIDTINGAFEPLENLVVPGVLMAVMYNKGKRS